VDPKICSTIEYVFHYPILLPPIPSIIPSIHSIHSLICCISMHSFPFLWVFVSRLFFVDITTTMVLLVVFLIRWLFIPSHPLSILLVVVAGCTRAVIPIMPCCYTVMVTHLFLLGNFLCDPILLLSTQCDPVSYSLSYVSPLFSLLTCATLHEAFVPICD